MTALLQFTSVLLMAAFASQGLGYTLARQPFAIQHPQGDGIRVSKTTGGVTTLYLVDDRNPTGFAQVLEELAVSGGTTNLTKVYTYGQDLIAQRIVSSGQRSFYGYDGNGNTRYLTGTNAAISDTYAYDAYGTLLASTGSTPNDYRFAGEQFDSSLGLCYLRARYLNTGTGRFWSRDSFAGLNEDPASLHKYLYCGNNPANCGDPSGHENVQSSLILTAISLRIATLTAPAVVAAQRSAQSVIRGLQHVQRLAHAAIARGSELLSWEQRLQNAAGENIGNFKLDLIIQRVTSQGQTINTLIEGKGVPWHLARNTAAWNGYLTQLENQARAFSQATQSGGVQIQERIIVFSSKIPPGLENAAQQIEARISQFYASGGIRWGVEAFEEFLGQ